MGNCTLSSILTFEFFIDKMGRGNDKCCIFSGNNIDVGKNLGMLQRCISEFLGSKRNDCWPAFTESKLVKSITQVYLSVSSDGGIFCCSCSIWVRSLDSFSSFKIWQACDCNRRDLVLLDFAFHGLGLNTTLILEALGCATSRMWHSLLVLG